MSSLKIKTSLSGSFTFIKKNKKKITITFVSLFTFALAFIFLLNFYYGNKLSPYIKNMDDIDKLEIRNAAVILGAGINKDNTPTQMLKDRLDTGFQLLKQGRVNRLILSGDNRKDDYSEPQVMIDYLVDKGVDKNLLVADYAGRRTYDSCYRAKEIFGQTKIYIVTQEFHITRSVYLCRSLGIDTIGITADLHSYVNLWENVVRDYIGMVGAVLDTKILHPTPVLGPKIDIN